MEISARPKKLSAFMSRTVAKQCVEIEECSFTINQRETQEK